ncbi:MAG TPA: hypothetical protein VFU54_05875 [Actinomycetota bacterium]|nr:hypothetical protein [Actinomycetota bacterium]
MASHWPPAGRAAPSLGPFAELLGQPYQRLKVAVLRELAALPTPSWPLADAERALTWLEPATAVRLLGELRADGLLLEADAAAGSRPSERPEAWRLSDEGQLVAAVCAVLAAPRIAPERAVKVLGAVMTLASAAEVDDRAAFAPFVAATAVLERDHAALVRRIREGADDALQAASRLAAAHLADMAELVEQAGAGHDAERHRAATVRGRLQALLDEVTTTAQQAGGDAAEVGSRLEVVPSAAELRAVVAATDLATLAGLVAGRPQLPPAIPPARAGAALAALDELLGRPEPAVVPLPEPVLLPIESPEVVPDFVLLAADVMTWLAGLGDTDLARWVIGGTWAEATARMAAAVEAWSRWGPAGDGSLAADLDPQPRFEVVGHDEVGIVSWTGVSAPRDPAERPEDSQQEPATAAHAWAATQERAS